jgi:flagellar biosynthesis/type III secretory pathway protein FliH
LRLKAKRDEQARLQSARLEGREEGLKAAWEEGVQLGEERGTIRTLEQLLNLTPTEASKLDSLSLEELKQTVIRLQGELRNRG